MKYKCTFSISYLKDFNLYTPVTYFTHLTQGPIPNKDTAVKDITTPSEYKQNVTMNLNLGGVISETKNVCNIVSRKEKYIKSYDN